MPALHYGCQLWGMHAPTGEAKAAPANLQSIYDRVLRGLCAVKHAPRAALLEELALSPLQVFWWQQTSEFWNIIPAIYLTTFCQPHISGRRMQRF